MHPFDKLFYDKELGEYTPRKYSDALQAQYGGIDSLLLWPTYPMSGIDDRNQFDLWRAAPGGLSKLGRAIHDLQVLGIRVLMPYNPWDQGTR